MPGFTDLTSGSGSSWDLNSYLQVHPEVVKAWTSNENNSQSYGTIEKFALAHAKAWGSDQEKLAASTYTPPTSYSQATATPTGADDNFRQVQNAAQAGQFNTTGTTATNQQQTTGQTGTSNQQQTTNQVGTTEQQQLSQELKNYLEQQQSAKQGTTDQTATQHAVTSTSDTSKPIDTLGFGALLQGQQGSAQATDTSRNAFLQDVMNTGGTGFNSQVNQAVRDSLSGPTMTGVGESAGSRAAAYAAEQIARNNMGQRLTASEQLAGPTAVETLSTTANPYIGKQTDSTGVTDSTTNTKGTYNETGTNTNTGTSSTTGLSNLLGTNTTAGTSNTTGSNASTGWTNLLGTTNESNAGTSTAQSSQAAAGLIPEGKQVSSGGGCVLCTVGLELGLFRTPRLLRHVIDYKLNKAWSRFRSAARGYFFLYTPFAKWLLDHPRVAAHILPLAKMVVYEELRVSGRRIPFKVGPWLIHWIGHGLCALVGKFPVSGRVEDTIILDLTKKFRVNFNVRN
jgi:hypothetical protein